MTSGAGPGGVGVGARPTLGAFGADRLRRGALRALVFLAGRDFPAIFRRVDFRTDAFRLEDLEADFFRRGAFRFDAFLAKISPPLQHVFGNRNPIHHKGDPLSRRTRAAVAQLRYSSYGR
jgi:hypothetical protein